MEMIYVSLVGTIGSLLSIYLIFTLQTRKMKLEQAYNIKRFRLGKRYKLKEMELPAKVENKGMGRGVVDNIVDGLIERYVGPSEMEEEAEEPNEDIIHTIVREIQNSPDAKKAIGKFLGGKKEEPTVYR